MCASRRAAADEPEVPIATQIDLLAKVVKYDHNAADRMGGTCRALVLRRAGDAGSTRISAIVKAELTDLGEIAGATIAISEHEYREADELATKCKDGGIGMLIVTPGFSDSIASIARALVDTDLLTVSVLARDVPPGIVLGFALESSRPTILVNLAQAKRQNVDFSARLLALAKVVG